MLDLSETTADEWIAALPPMHAKTIQAMVGQGTELNDIALNWLGKSGPENTFPFGARSAEQNFYDRVVVEIRKLICGDPSYDTLRKQIAKEVKQHKGKIIAAIAAAVGAVVGISAVVLVPVVGVVLAIACKVGVNAWCKADQTITPPG